MSGVGEFGALPRYSGNMRKKTPRQPRESLLGGGWTVEGDTANSEISAGTAQAHEGVEPAPSGDAAPVPSQTGDNPVGDPAIDATDDPTEHSGEQVSSGALLLYGIFGGIYLIYTWVWITWAQYYADLNELSAAGSGSIGGVLQQVVYWAAPFAPALWFLSVVLSIRSDLRRMTVLLIVGAIVLLPLPMFLQGVGL